jgi:hypothetical protein
MRIGNVVECRRRTYPLSGRRLTELGRSLCPTATAVSTFSSVRVHDSRSNSPSAPFTRPRYDEQPPISGRLLSSCASLPSNKFIGKHRLLCMKETATEPTLHASSQPATSISPSDFAHGVQQGRVLHVRLHFPNFSIHCSTFFCSSIPSTVGHATHST